MSLIQRTFQFFRSFPRKILDPCHCITSINCNKINYSAALNYGKFSPILREKNEFPESLKYKEIQQKTIPLILTTWNIIENSKETNLREINDFLYDHKFIKRNSIQDPISETAIIDIQAARMIVIRRRKMRKHKLRKLRKKMKFEWAKVRQRREMRKEKAFQAVLIEQIKEAEKFSAMEYVNQKLQTANTNPIPKFWKGKRLPEFIIKEKLGIK